METQDELQILIDQAREKLPKESRAAIDSVNWKLTILEMGKKYNETQLETLETETELLLCGIESPEDYQKELEARMMIPKEEVASLLNEMDKLIFKKIQAELEKRISLNNKITSTPSIQNVIKTTPTIDSRFINLPKNIQEAITKSDYKKSLYDIGGKYKLNIEQMGVLEEITIKVMTSELHSDKYEEELTSKLGLLKDDVSNLVNDINESIFKKIREEEKVITNYQLPITKEKEVVIEDEVPLPPYKKIIAVEKLPIIENKEVPKKIDFQQESIITPKSILEEKLSGPMASSHTISDYSAPSTTKPSIGENLPKSHDPYREAI